MSKYNKIETITLFTMRTAQRNGNGRRPPEERREEASNSTQCVEHFFMSAEDSRVQDSLMIRIFVSAQLPSSLPSVTYEAVRKNHYPTSYRPRQRPRIRHVMRKRNHEIRHYDHLVSSTTTVLVRICLLVLALALKEQRSGYCLAAGATISASTWKQWLEARCGIVGGGGGKALWVYKGALYDPLNGNKICNVEGVEIVRKLAVIDNDPTSALLLEDSDNCSSNTKWRYQRRCGDLTVVDSLADPKAMYDFAGTLLSRKLFCYTTDAIQDDNATGRQKTRNGRVAGTSGNSILSSSGSGRSSSREQLLRRIRLRPNSPLRAIPINQAAAVYDTATTIVQKSPSEAYLHTEYPDGRSIWTQPSIILNNSSGNKKTRTFEYVTYARPISAPWRNKLPLTNTSTASKNKRGGSSDVSVSPPRSSLIQIGNNDGNNSSGAGGGGPRFGVRETYQYTFDGEDEATVRYTRYGEGPIWYGPNRLCTMELVGRRVASWNEVPRICSEIATQRIMGFFATANSAISNDDDLMAQRAVMSFRGKGHAPLRIAPTSSDEDDSSNGGRGPSIVPGWLYNTFNKVQSATSFSAK